MKFFTTLLLAGTFLLLTSSKNAKDYLKKCWEQQVKPIDDQLISFSYSEENNQLYHSPEPWQTLKNQSRGCIRFNSEQFLQNDTIFRGDKQKVSLMQYSKNELLVLPYWSKKLLPISQSELNEQIFDLARYNPASIIRLFMEEKVNQDQQNDDKYAIYTHNIQGTEVSLYIRKSDCLLEKMVTKQAHNIYGDLTETYHYNDYGVFRKLFYPKQISIDKIHGIKNEVMIRDAQISLDTKPLLEKPKDYLIKDDILQVPEISVEKIGKHVYSINLKHVETKIGLIEFKDFFVVLDAPLSSENGELIIAEAKKIVPDKPIRYFAFCHHHPWYIGGVRAFIHNGTKIICTKDDISYLQFIADAPRTIQPDSLQIKHRPLLVESLDSQMTISDGQMELKIFHIGKKSSHTNDYLIFYLPSEKMVFEGDLVSVPKEGAITKAGVSQAGLYQAIKDLGIEVDMVVQSWPTGEQRSNKHMIPFKEIEASVLMK